HLGAAPAEPGRDREPREPAADDAGARAGADAPGLAQRPRQVERAHRLQMDRHPALEAAADVDAGDVGHERVRQDFFERHRGRLSRSHLLADEGTVSRMANAPDSPPPEEPVSRAGKFIKNYHSFLSTFVIGAAGLIATSIWQYKQSEIAR